MLKINLYFFIFEKRFPECAGSSTGFSYVLYPSRSKAYQDQFRNCTVVNRNLEIVSIHDDIDENFLDTIEEVHNYLNYSFKDQ